MLILTRKPKEVLYILIGSEAIKVTVLGIRKNVVRLGIDAPPSIEVHREEIYERIQIERNAKDR